MRVAVTLEQCWHRVPGGTARAALDTVAAVAERGDVEQVGVSAWHRGPPPAPWRPTVPVLGLPLPRIALYDAWQRLRRPRVERATGPVDVVHATGHVAPASRAPWVATINDLHFMHEPSHFTRRGVAVANRFLTVVRAEASVVICPSTATVADCQEAGIDATRLRMVPYGIASELADETEVARVRETYDLHGRFVLFAGTLEPRKNVPRLLEAFARLGDVNAQLVLVGPAGWGDLPHTTARQLGFVPRSDLDALYRTASVVCYPSLREGFGLPVLEAMAQGAVVVTSRTTSTAEVAGQAALLVDPLDVDDIAAALARALEDEDLAARLRVAATARAKEFSWPRAAAAVVSAYADAIGSPP